MKKSYLFLALVLMISSANAQTILIDDNYDSYNLGFLSAQSPHWETWSGVEGSGEDAQVTDVQSASNPQAMVIIPNDDIILILGDQTSSTYTVQWDVYIGAGSTGYYNFQQFGVPGDFGGEVQLKVDGFMQFDFATTVSDVAYPVATWFTLKHVVDLDAATIQIFLDDTEIVNTPYDGGSNLGGIDFFGSTATNLMYVDNLLFAEGILKTTEFMADNFSLYPNPMKGILNIQSTTPVDTVVLYNLLGEVVLQSAPGIISPSISTSSLASGIYLVQITSGAISKTIKVIK